MFETIRNKRLRDLSIGRVARALRRRVVDIPHRLTWTLDLPRARRNRERLEEYRHRHGGERCVVVANGASLNRTDLSLLRGVATIGMNRIHLIQERTAFVPTYLVVVDIETKLEQFRDEFAALKIPRFFNWNARHLFNDDPTLMYVKDSPSPKFQPDCTRVIGSGKSVTYTCLQLAFFMGFTEVILIGKDHDYGVAGKPHELRTSTGLEAAWFVSGYHDAGTKFRVPDLLGEEYAYRQARSAYERAGRRVVDATVDGKLTVFEKMGLRQALQAPAR